MGIRKRPKLWTGIGAAALMSAAAPQVLAAAGAGHPPSGQAHMEQGAGPAEFLLAARGGGEGGEGGEGGASAGGEFGVDPASAAHDPVPYIIVLDVIRAHYLAGLAAFEAGDTETAGAMFVHPISEVYLAMEDVFKAQGVKPFDDAMLMASQKVFENAPSADVRAAAKVVFAAVDAAETRAPGSEKPEGQVEAAILSDLIDRAALQYQLAEAGREGAAFVDGYGFYRAAEARAGKTMDKIEEANPKAAEAIRAALGKLKEAYPGISRPKSPSVEAGKLLALSSRIRFEVAD